MPSLPFVIGPGHIYSIAKSEAEAKADKRYSKNVNYHGLGDQTVKDILERVSDPVMIIFSKDVNANAVPMRSTHSIVAIADIGINGESIFAPIEITAERTINGGQYDVNVLSSVYGKSAQNLVAEAIARENIGDVGVFYLNSKASALLADGVQFPKRLTDALASNGIVHSFSEKVNMNISDATQSQQFKRWFGDWQNHPEDASKVVNDDGTPMVVYHGSDSLHNIFSYGNIGTASGTPILGDGFYFTDNAELAKGYGENVYECYLQIKKPYYATEADVYKLNANTLAAQGYDGVILKAPAGNVYMTIDNTQIKSATDNIGTFDGNNPDIRYSLSEQTTAPAGGYRITGEDIALAPTREDIARMEQEIATAQTAPRNDIEELGAPTREDIARMERDKKLNGPLLMKNSLDRELEKLYRLQQTKQIQDDAYFLELSKVNEAYQAAGRDLSEALGRVVGAYQGETVNDTAVGKTNAVTKPLNSYPAEKQNAIRSYLQSVDEQIKSFVKRVKGGDLRFERRKVSDVNERAASDIQKLLGIDVSGYTHNINTSGVQHILRRHGKNGKQDTTMSIDDDIARVGWVLDNYDSVELLTKDGEQVYSSEFKDKNNQPVPQIRFIKKIDGTYYVVEAACENEHQKLWVQSAYLQKNEDVTQVSAEGQEANHKTYAQGELASPSSNNSIPKNVAGVKQEELEAVLGEKDAYVSKQANALYDEVKSMQKGKRVSNTLSYLLDTLDLSEENKAESYGSLKLPY